MRPSGPMTVSVSRPWSRPISKSIGSWPGVILSAPEPNSGSTRESAMTGTWRPTTGTTTSLPIASAYRGSSGFTATATSARIVAGRTVAMVIDPEPSTNGYRA